MEFAVFHDEGIKTSPHWLVFVAGESKGRGKSGAGGDKSSASKPPDKKAPTPAKEKDKSGKVSKEVGDGLLVWTSWSSQIRLCHGVMSSAYLFFKNFVI